MTKKKNKELSKEMKKERGILMKFSKKMKKELNL